MRSLFAKTLKRNHKNDRKEFETLATPLMDNLYSTALGMTKNPFDAEDLVQDAYLKAWRFFYQFEPGTNFRGWIFRILTTTFINQYKKKKRRPTQVDFDTIAAVLPEKETSELKQYRDSDFIENYASLFDDTITSALNKLPDYYRIVVILSDVAELSYKEIASIIGVPIGTVMSRLSRARKQLAETLKNYATQNGYISAQTPIEACC